MRIPCDSLLINKMLADAAVLIYMTYGAFLSSIVMIVLMDHFAKCITDGAMRVLERYREIMDDGYESEYEAEYDSDDEEPITEEAIKPEEDFGPEEEGAPDGFVSLKE
jgi:hypothetical protein